MKLSILFLALSFITSSGALAKSSEIDDPNSSNIYVSNVLDDLSEDSSFNSEDYSGIDFGFVRFYEFGYSPTSKTYFNLISYFYINPDNIRDASNPDGLYSTETLYIQTKLNDGSWGKVDLSVLSYENGYFKASLKNPDLLYSSSKSSRVYEISGLTVKYYQEGKASSEHEFTVASKYTYSGYAKSMNGNSVSTLSCKEDSTTVIEVKPQLGVWMSESSGNIRTAIYYSYFNIPTNISNAYGELYQIRYQYKLVQLKTMYAMTQDLYDYYTYDGEEYKWRVYVRYQHSPTEDHSVQFPTEPEEGEWVWESTNGKEDIISNKDLVFITKTDRADVTSSALEARYAEVGDSLALNTKDFDITTENLTQKVEIRQNNLNGLERWWQSTFQNVAYSDKKYNDINTWDIISSSTFANSSLSDLSDELICNKEDLKNIRDNYLKLGQTTYLFRYETRPYYSEDIKGFIKDLHLNAWDSKNDKYSYRSGPILTYKSSGEDVTGYYFDSYATVDFDIISFVFQKDGSVTLIPVVQDPVSNFPNPIAPDVPNKTGINWKLIFYVLLGILLVVTLTIIFIKVYPTLKLASAVKSSSKGSLNKRRRK